MIITVDGPVGSGKSSVALALAKRLKIHYLNTGLLYRTAAYILIHKLNKDLNNLEPLNEDELGLLDKISYEFIDDKPAVYFDGEASLDGIKPGINALLYPSNDLDAATTKKMDGFFNTEVTYGVDEEGESQKNEDYQKVFRFLVDEAGQPLPERLVIKRGKLNAVEMDLSLWSLKTDIPAEELLKEAIGHFWRIPFPYVLKQTKAVARDKLNLVIKGHFFEDELSSF